MERQRVANDSDRASRIAQILLDPQVRAQLFRWAQQCISDREDAEDVVAVLVEKVARTYPDSEIDRIQVLAVAYRAAKTISLDEIRKQRSEKRGGSATRVPYSEEAIGVYWQSCGAVEAEWVESLLERLPQDLQGVARLHVFEGLDITSAIRSAMGDLDDRSLATARARWYHHVHKLQAVAQVK